MFEVITFAMFACILLACALKPQGRCTLDHPFALYSTVFAIYEFGPMGVWSLTDQPAEISKWAVLGMACLALLGVAVGMHLGSRGLRSESGKLHGEPPPPAMLKGPLIVTALLIWATAVHYGILISEGQINTHVNPYVVQTSVFDSVFVVFMGQGRFAAILLLGFICGSAPARTRRLVLYGLVVYSAALICLLVLTSETRPAFTGAVCFLAAWRLATRRQLSLKLLLGSAVIIGIGAGLIQQVRQFDLDTIRLSDSPISAAGRTLLSSASGILRGELRDNNNEALWSRVGDGPRLTAAIWEQIASGSPEMYGDGLRHALVSVLPRVLYPEKGKVDPLDAYTERALGVPEYDGCLTSFGYAFAEGGWIAVLLFHVCLGFTLALATRKALRCSSALWWLGCAFLWETALQMENELVMDGATALRAVAIYSVILIAASSLNQRRGAKAIRFRARVRPLLPAE